MKRVITIVLAGFLLLCSVTSVQAKRKKKSLKVQASVRKGLDYLARQQRKDGYWEANQGQYRVAMTALAGTAMLAEGSTTNSGRYQKNIKSAVDYLVEMWNPKTGLIGYKNDFRYTYGHGFSMLFLSQVYGEEEDKERREELKKVLAKAVQFSGEAQTNRGGWGYVSAKDGNQFDEGSTCVTQVQGLRACRNAGIPVPKELIDKSRKYIKACTMPDGGIAYSFSSRGSSRPAISAAAVAVMYSAGDEKSKSIKKMLKYCEKNVWPGGGRRGGGFGGGHFHYMHLYYSQIIYRKGDKQWEKYMKDIGKKILQSQSASGAWQGGHVGPIYTTAICATILQMDNGYLPIYQR